MKNTKVQWHPEFLAAIGDHTKYTKERTFICSPAG